MQNTGWTAIREQLKGLFFFSLSVCVCGMCAVCTRRCSIHLLGVYNLHPHGAECNDLYKAIIIVWQFYSII